MIFNKDTVKMYDTHNTQVIVTWEAVINGWPKNKTGMWQVALVPIVSNVNTVTVLVDQPPMESFRTNHYQPRQYTTSMN